MTGPDRTGTERNWSQENTRRLYEHALTALHEGLALVDPETMQVLAASDAFAKILGRDLDQVVGHFPWEWDILHGKGDLLDIGDLIRRGEHDPEGSHESIIRRPDGAQVNVELNISQVVQDGAPRLFMTCRDITDAKRAQQEREASELRAQLATESAGIGIWEWEVTSGRITASKEFESALGDRTGEIVAAQDWIARVHPDDLARSRSAMDDCLQGRTENFGIELRMRRGDGGYKWISSFGKVVERDGEGRARRLIGTVRDVDARKSAEEALHNREALLSAILDYAPGAVLLVDERTRKIVQFNDHAATMHGYTAQEFFSIEPATLRISPTKQELEKWWTRLRRAGEVTLEGMHRRKDGSTFEVQIRSRLIEIGDRRYALTIWTDISQLKAAQRALTAQKEEIRSLVEHSPDGMIRYDRDLKRVYVNAAMHNFLGNAAEGLIGTRLRKPARIALPDEYVRVLKETFRTGRGSGQIEMSYMGLGGEERWGLVSFVPELDERGDVVTVLMTIRDVTALVEHRRKIHQLAFNDSLTGLANRNAFNERFSEVLENCRATNTEAALLIFDLDLFKNINDSLGHAAGDELLRQIGARLSAEVRRGDVIARLGGDEFAVLLPQCAGRQDVGAVVERIHQTFLAPFDLGQREVFASATIGVALFPGDGRTTDDLFAHADAAMYTAKSFGRGGVQYYTHDLSGEAARRLVLLTDLKSACAAGQFELVYQPKVSLGDGACVGAEALLRWRHPEHGLMSPDAFIPLAEETGVIVEMGRWVLQEACRTAAEWNHASGSLFRVAVNLSSRQFIANDIAADVRNALTTTGCRGEWLECEITESLILNDNEGVQEALAELSRMGVTVAIDDFGTGQSALAYLNRFHVDVLKIDRSFVDNMECDWRKAELVKAFLSLADALELETVAEGIETSDQMRILRRLGCPVGQGYHFSMPLAELEFRQRFLRQEAQHGEAQG